MEKLLRFLEKYIIPEKVYRWGQPIYHFSLAFAGALVYRFPSKKLYVIGVTGTKGKTTTCNLIYHFLTSYGYKTGLLTTVNFKIDNQEWINETKKTMLGRLELQKWLRRMVKEGCAYAVVETSSEGIAQFRHRFIDYRLVVFTNLSPEHVERHGGFENYRAAKVKLFEKVAKRKNGIGIYNMDDENVNFFLGPPIAKKIGYTADKFKNQNAKIKMTVQNSKFPIGTVYEVSNINLSSDKTEFDLNGIHFISPLLGEFNAYNAAAAVAVAVEVGVSLENTKTFLTEFRGVPGRLEMIKTGSGVTVVIDYAHEPMSLEAVYSTVRGQMLDAGNKRLIGVLGAQGGGRDKWKRPIMGEIAAKYCDFIVLTNEDPYDEDPYRIIADIRAGVANTLFPVSNLFDIPDRAKAIEHALRLARPGDVVVLTGKGGEVWMCVDGGKKIPWNEREVVETILKKIFL